MLSSYYMIPFTVLAILWLARGRSLWSVPRGRRGSATVLLARALPQQ